MEKEGGGDKANHGDGDEGAGARSELLAKASGGHACLRGHGGEVIMK